jgi:hypothetical protein
MFKKSKFLGPLTLILALVMAVTLVASPVFAQDGPKVPPTDHPPKGGQPTEQPPTVEPPVDEPPTEEPPVDATEEPPVDEPPTEEPPVIDEAPPVISIDGSAPVVVDGSVPTQYQALAAEVQRSGSIRVLVGLNVTFAPEGGLSAAQASAQQASIQQAQAAVLTDLAGTSFSVNATYWAVPYMALTVDANALSLLAKSPLVSVINQDKLNKPNLGTSTVVVGAVNAHLNGVTGLGQTVAVLDTGVRGTHPFLVDKLVAEACFSTTGTILGDVSESVCPGGGDVEIGVGAADPQKCVDKIIDGDTEKSSCSHGTHVSGIAVGKDPGGLNFDGMAPDAKLIGVDVFSYSPADDNVYAWDSDIVQGLQFVYDQIGAPGVGDIVAVNMSLGGGRYFDQTSCDWDNMATKAMIDTLKSVGVATVISSGNNGYKDSMGSPGCISSAVSVGATTDQDRVAGFSNSTYFLSLLAPGVYIESSVLYGSGYDDSVWLGTSMAAPHVTGAWALYRESYPNASVGEVLGALQDNGVPIVDENGIVKSRIQIDAAIGLVPPATPTPGVLQGDDFDNPLLIDPLPYNSGPLDPLNFTTYFDDPLPSCSLGGAAIGPSIWFQYDALADGLLDLDASLSVHDDTIIAAYTGTRGALTEVGCNDDIDLYDLLTPELRSRLVLPVAAGTTYYIQFGGWSIGAVDPLQLTADLVTAPANDNIASATNITSLPFSDLGVDLFTASWDPVNDPWPSCNANAYELGPTVWYTYTPTAAEVLNINVGYDFGDPIIGIYTGAPGSLVEQACAFYGLDYSVPAASAGPKALQAPVIPEGATVVAQGESFRVPTVANEIYYIMVTGYDGSRGTVDVSVSTWSPGTSVPDEYGDAVDITSLPFNDTSVNLDDATTGENDPSTQCNPYGFEKTVWYTFTPADSGRYYFEAIPSNIPPDPPQLTIALYTGDDVVGFSEVACSASGIMGTGLGEEEGHQTKNVGLVKMAPPLAAGVPYTLVIGTYYVDQGDNTALPLGDLALYVDEIAPGPYTYENFDTPMVITDPLPFNDQVADTFDAFSYVDDPVMGCAPYIGHTLWYEYTPADNVRVRLDTVGSDYDTVIGVYTGTRGALTQVACGDEIVDTYGNYVSSQTLIDVDMAATSTYYIMVGGYSSDYGSLNFTAQAINPPNATPLPVGARPVPLTPANKSSTNYPWGVNISWQPVAGATAYDLQVSDAKNFSTTWVNVTLETSSTVLGTYLPEDKYYWRVRVSPAGPWSKRFEFTVDYTAPAQVAVLQSPKPLEGVSDNTPRFRWKRVKDAANYRLIITDNYYDAMCPDIDINPYSCVPNPGYDPDVPGSGYTAWGNTFYDSWLGSSRSNYTLRDVEALYTTGTYFWSIQAQDKAGNWGDVSVPQAFSLINLRSPKNEQVLKAKATKALVLKWSKMDNVKGYQVQVSDTILFQNLIVDQWTDKTSYKTQALPHGVYYWRVNPDTPFGIWESPVIWKVIIAPSIPGKVKPVSPSNKAVLSTNQPVLTWEMLNPLKYGYVTYDIQVDTDRRFSAPLTVYGVGGTSQALPAMAPGKYYWRVRAVNEYGAPGRWGARREFTIP